MGIIITRTVPSGSLPAGSGEPIAFNLPSTGLPTGFDTLVGTNGNDSLGFEFGVEGVIFGQQGNDILTGAVPGKVANLFGGKGNDTIVGFGGFNYANGNKGDDSIYGSDVFESLRGGQDNDTVIAGNGSDTVYGDLGNDLLIGSGLTTDPLTEDGNFIYGGDGTDTIYGGAGSDLIYGGQGNDLIDVNPSILIEGLRTLPQLAHSTGSDRVFGDLGNDTIGREDASGNKIYDGGVGDDSVVGGLGEDSVVGDVGNDTLRGSQGFDTVVGGDGNDSMQGGDEAGALATNALIGGDSMLGGRGDDTINGNNGADTIDGGIGTDSILGGEGKDSILGDDQADILRGETGDDRIIGGRDNDTIEGGAGSDTLTGGLIGETTATTPATPGEDIFDYSTFIGSLVTLGNTGAPAAGYPSLAAGLASTLSSLAAGGVDLITDFRIGDKIRINQRTVNVDLVADANATLSPVAFGGFYTTTTTPTFGQIGSVSLTDNSGLVVYIETSGAYQPGTVNPLVAGSTATFDSQDIVIAVLQGVSKQTFDGTNGASANFTVVS